MDEKGIFRSAIGGFHKQDVLDYIDHITGEWDEERQALQQEADVQREEADRARATAKEATDTLEEWRERLTALEEELRRMTAQRDEAIAEKDALAAQLAREREQSRTAAAEITAAQEKLHAREEELRQVRQTLNEQTEAVAQYEAVLGKCGEMKQHMDGIVRPFVENANRRATDTLSGVQTALEALLDQLGELKNSVSGQRQALEQEKTRSDRGLSDTLDAWTEKARGLAQEAAGRVTHFFR